MQRFHMAKFIWPRSTGHVAGPEVVEESAEDILSVQVLRAVRRSIKQLCAHEAHNLSNLIATQESVSAAL